MNYKIGYFLAALLTYFALKAINEQKTNEQIKIGKSSLFIYLNSSADITES